MTFVHFVGMSTHDSTDSRMNFGVFSGLGFVIAVVSSLANRSQMSKVKELFRTLLFVGYLAAVARNDHELCRVVHSRLLRSGEPGMTNQAGADSKC